ncbi:substrate-binding domain-containing protein [Micrococcaceae bacterium Sec5.7]
MLDEGRSGMIVVTSAFGAARWTPCTGAAFPLWRSIPSTRRRGDVVSVGASNWAGGKAATAHLLELGHRRIAYLGGPETAECSQARLHGYMAALMAQGVTVEEAVHHSWHLPARARSSRHEGAAQAGEPAYRNLRGE